MTNKYDGLSIGDVISLDQMTLNNRYIYNGSVIVVPTGNTAADGSPEMKVMHTAEAVGNYKDFFQMLSAGEIPNRMFVYKFGRNAAVGATEQIIAALGVYGLPPTAQTIDVISTVPASDNGTGIGARTVRLVGLDGNHDPIEEVVTVGETSILAFLRVPRFFVETAGNTNPIGGGNVGILTAKQTTSAIDMNVIQLNDAQSLCACYTVPNGYTAYMWSADTTTGEGKNSTNKLKSREFVTDAPFRVKGIRDNFENTINVQFKVPGKFLEKTDIVFTARSEASGTAVSGTFLLELVKN